jgi:RND family efflux transporter MFP subunit
VQAIKPKRGLIERTTSQPGSLYAFESAALFAKVSGYLKTQDVDIGTKVHRGDVVAVIDAPELDIEVQQLTAAIVEAKSEVDQMKAHLVTARAKWDSAVAAAAETEADLGRATAQRAFREKQYQRIKKLFELNSIDERLVDEKQDEMQAAQASERAAQAAIVTAKANVAAAAARIEEAKADLANAEAKVQVADSARAKAQAFADYERIVSPYNGVITRRSFNRGDFIRAAERSGEAPLLVVDRTDLLRTVVFVPDLDVPWVEPGNAAIVEIDALPGEAFHATVSRMADSEDPQSRTMRVEIDLPNPSGRLRQGMYGRVTIKLRAGVGGLLVPASCIVGPLKDGKGAVYVVRGGKAILVEVKVGSDDGSQIEVRQGLSADDEVVVHYNGAIGDGVPVAIVNNGQP